MKVRNHWNRLGSRPAALALAAAALSLGLLAAPPALAAPSTAALTTTLANSDWGTAAPMRLKAGDTSLNDPECNVGTPGLLVHDDNEAPDDGYGFNPIAGAPSGYFDKFTPSNYPATFSTVCLSFVTRRDPAPTLPIELVVYADDGAGGAPGTELGRTPATANKIIFASGTGDIKQSFQAFDISSMNLSIASGSVYIGAEWDPTKPENDSIFLAADKSATTLSAGGWAHYGNDDVWEPIASAQSDDYKAMFIRALEGTDDPVVPPASEHVAAVPTLSQWTLIVLAGLLGAGSFVTLRRRG